MSCTTRKESRRISKRNTFEKHLSHNSPSQNHRLSSDKRLSACRWWRIGAVLFHWNFRMNEWALSQMRAVSYEVFRERGPHFCSTSECSRSIAAHPHSQGRVTFLGPSPRIFCSMSNESICIYIQALYNIQYHPLHIRYIFWVDSGCPKILGTPT